MWCSSHCQLVILSLCEEELSIFCARVTSKYILAKREYGGNINYLLRFVLQAQQEGHG